MTRVARMFSHEMQRRGHHVEQWTADAVVGRLIGRTKQGSKWIGYIDQFLIYPWVLARKIKKEGADTLFVVIDQALGMWVPRFRHRPHVIHCNDFLALRSALGDIRENPTGFTGKIYQHLIRRGFSKGSNFISISKATECDLKKYKVGTIRISTVGYLGLNANFERLTEVEAKGRLGSHFRPADNDGFFLHVGGNQWYKNREGVLRLYSQYCQSTADPMPLWMVGAKPSETLVQLANQVPENGEVRFISELDDNQVIAAYCLATLFLFPSLEEGFGWPIAEAMACGTLVLTTDAAPMTEVGGDAAIYHRRMTLGDEDNWARDGAAKIADFLAQPDAERQRRIDMGLMNAERFSTNASMELYESVYHDVLATYINEMNVTKTTVKRLSHDK